MRWMVGVLKENNCTAITLLSFGPAEGIGSGVSADVDKGGIPRTLGVISSSVSKLSWQFVKTTSSQSTIFKTKPSCLRLPCVVWMLCFLHARPRSDLQSVNKCLCVLWKLLGSEKCWLGSCLFTDLSVMAAQYSCVKLTPTGKDLHSTAATSFMHLGKKNKKKNRNLFFFFNFSV